MKQSRRDVSLPYSALTAALRFIVVDDEAIICRFIARVIALNYPDAIIITTSNGEAALREYEQHGADMIVTDRIMPQMDGLVLTRSIRAQDAGIPIVLVSGSGDRPPEAAATGATRFLKKPFSVGQLRAMLIALLPLLPVVRN
jgi:CheY-like chemotaxis protein